MTVVMLNHIMWAIQSGYVKRPHSVLVKDIENSAFAVIDHQKFLPCFLILLSTFGGLKRW